MLLRRILTERQSNEGLHARPAEAFLRIRSLFLHRDLDPAGCEWPRWPLDKPHLLSFALAKHVSTPLSLLLHSRSMEGDLYVWGTRISPED